MLAGLNRISEHFFTLWTLKDSDSLITSFGGRFIENIAKIHGCVFQKLSFNFTFSAKFISFSPKHFKNAEPCRNNHADGRENASIMVADKFNDAFKNRNDVHSFSFQKDVWASRASGSSDQGHTFFYPEKIFVTSGAK